MLSKSPAVDAVTWTTSESNDNLMSAVPTPSGSFTLLITIGSVVSPSTSTVALPIETFVCANAGNAKATSDTAKSNIIENAPCSIVLLFMN